MRNLSFLCGTAASLRMRHMYNKTLLVGGLLAASLVAPAYANEAEAVGKLMRTGQYGEALGKADAYLAQNPKDAQMRFLKGVILTEQNRAGEAIGIFTKLTEDYPDLPEPYNNLAVLHASSGQYDKARAALDMAIRTNPSYATAYENLGDVHAKLASQAYDKALQLDSGNAGAKSKLTLLRNLSVAGSRPAAANVKVAAAAPAAKPAAPAQKPETVAKAEPAKTNLPRSNLPRLSRKQHPPRPSRPATTSAKTCSRWSAPGPRTGATRMSGAICPTTAAISRRRADNRVLPGRMAAVRALSTRNVSRSRSNRPRSASRAIPQRSSFARLTPPTS